MPELIARGYRYLAPPPRYRAKRGSSEVYLKDDEALEDYLLSSAVDEGTVLTTFDGAQLAGPDLRHQVEDARVIKTQLERLSRHVPIRIVEQASILGALNPQILSDENHAAEIGDYAAKRLDALEPEAERGWVGKVKDDGGLAFTRTLRGVEECHVIDSALIQSAEARKLDAKAGELQKLYMRHGTLVVKDKEISITGPVSLVNMIMQSGRKGIGMQRYKGLGEMNPDQLWETTLDPNARSLLQVKVNHADDAEKVFSTLMGDLVEPRRDFIQANALKVANLDV
jgi:DNA gyrase subunit B